MATTAPFSPMVCSPVSDGYLGWGHRQVWSTIDEDFGKLLVGFRHKLGVRILKNNIDKPGCSCRQGQTGSGKTFTMLSSWHGLAAKQSKTTVEEVATSMQNRTEILRICQNGPGLKQFTDFTGTGVSVWTEKGGLLLHRHTLKWNFFWLLRHLWNWLLGEVHESSIHVNSCCICACGKCFACQECPGSSRGLAQGESPPYW